MAPSTADEIETILRLYLEKQYSLSYPLWRLKLSLVSPMSQAKEKPV
jgi:hypothetical protein